MGGKVVDSLFFKGPNQAFNAQIHQLLHFSQMGKQAPARRRDFDMIFLAATPEAARQIKPLLKFYYAEDVPVYAVSLVYTGAPRAEVDSDLEGITFCDAPWVLGSEGPLPGLRQRISLLWAPSFQQNVRLYALGVDAYQIVADFANFTRLSQQDLPGATGTLHMDAQHRIVRQLPCAQFHQGVPIVLDR